METAPIDPRLMAAMMARRAADTRCNNIVVLDLRGRSPVTEFFVLATGTSNRQLRTVSDELSDLGRKSGFAPWRTSGYELAKWILVDFVNVVVHLFDADSRNFYDLELLWGDCPRVDWAALVPAGEEAEVSRVVVETISPVATPGSEAVERLVGEQISGEVDEAASDADDAAAAQETLDELSARSAGADSSAGIVEVEVTVVGVAAATEAARAGEAARRAKRPVSRRNAAKAKPAKKTAAKQPRKASPKSPAKKPAKKLSRPAATKSAKSPGKKPSTVAKKAKPRAGAATSVGKKGASQGGKRVGKLAAKRSVVGGKAASPRKKRKPSA